MYRIYKIALNKLIDWGLIDQTMKSLQITYFCCFRTFRIIFLFKIIKKYISCRQGVDPGPNQICQNCLQFFIFFYLCFTFKGKLQKMEPSELHRGCLEPSGSQEKALVNKSDLRRDNLSEQKISSHRLRMLNWKR